MSIYLQLPAIENLILETVLGDTELNVQRVTFYLYMHLLSMI